MQRIHDGNHVPFARGATNKEILITLITMSMRLPWRTAVVVASLLFLVFPVSVSSDIISPCYGYLSAVIVDTDSHTLWLCQGMEAWKSYRVALGQGGVDKRYEGDRKTPLGVYSLGDPRPSTRFGLFIPVGYPTEEQLSAGFSGGEIGIHGPHPDVSESEFDGTGVDWTEGCIAMGSDTEIAEVTRWILEQDARTILIK